MEVALQDDSDVSYRKLQTTHLPPSGDILSLKATGPWLTVNKDMALCDDPFDALFSPCSCCDAQGDFSIPPNICSGRCGPLHNPGIMSLSPVRSQGQSPGCCWETVIKRPFIGHHHPFSEPPLGPPFLLCFSVSLLRLPEKTTHVLAVRPHREHASWAALHCHVCKTVKGFQSHREKKQFENFDTRSPP